MSVAFSAFVCLVADLSFLQQTIILISHLTRSSFLYLNSATPKNYRPI